MNRNTMATGMTQLPRVTSTQGEDSRLYTVILKLGSWHKRLYFQSTWAGDGSRWFSALGDKVERIGAHATNMRDFADRVSAAFHDAGFIRIQK